jgi:hypothetical protein
MDPGVIGASVPIFMFAMIAVIVVVSRYFKAREREALQATLRAAIERGQPLPPEVVDAISRDARPMPSSGRDLRAGIIWVGIAAGIVGFAYALGFSDEAADAFWPMIGIACFPGFIGFAFLVMAALNRGRGRD